MNRHGAEQVGFVPDVHESGVVKQLVDFGRGLEPAGGGGEILVGLGIAGDQVRQPRHHPFDVRGGEGFDHIVRSWNSFSLLETLNINHLTLFFYTYKIHHSSSSRGHAL